MGQVRMVLMGAVLLAVAMGVLPVAAGAAAAGGPPALRVMPGLTAADTHPGACVDCHVIYRDRGMDQRLGVLLQKWTAGDVEPGLLALARASALPGTALKGRHPEAADSLGDIPGACLDCHNRASRKAPPFSRLIHLVHLEGGAQNHFMTVFQGECTLCHKLDTRSGEWRIPSGPEK